MLFHHDIESEPDPSLTWLLESPKRLHWVDGPAILPKTYTVRDLERGVWITYKGHNHSAQPATLTTPSKGETKRRIPRGLDAEADRVLLGTNHGVLLTDRSRSRHAWIYVFPGGHKLRWPSVVGARLEGDVAVIEVELRDGLTERHEVRVDLDTGRLLTREGGGRMLSPPAHLLLMVASPPLLYGG